MYRLDRRRAAVTRFSQRRRDVTFPENACDARERARARLAADSSGVAGRGERRTYRVYRHVAASNQLLDKTKHSRAALRDCDCDCDLALSLSLSHSRFSVFLSRPLSSFARFTIRATLSFTLVDDHKDVGGKFTLRFIGRCTM